MSGRMNMHFNSGGGRVRIPALNLPIGTHAMGATKQPLKVTVVPRPGPDGRVPTLDGRRLIVRDMPPLAARMNRQEVEARVDRDHQTEPTSPTYKGSTEASGWIRNYRVEGGAIVADMEVGNELWETLKSGRYKYLSPALIHSKDDEVVGLSSLALTNTPNMPALKAPTLHHREAALAAREAALKREEELAAVSVVDLAVGNGRVAAHDREHYLREIREHSDGITAGVSAFQALHDHGKIAAFAVPEGYSVGSSISLHHQIVRRATNAGLSYRDALVAIARAPVEVHVPVRGAVFREERMHLHRRIGAVARESGVSYRTALLHVGETEWVTPRGLTPPSDERMALHERIALDALDGGTTYRDAIVHLSAMGATGSGKDRHSASFERIRSKVRGMLESVAAKEAVGLLERAEALVRFADGFMEAGDDDRALATIEQAKKVIAAAERVAGGDISGAQRWSNWPAPTEATAGREYATLKWLGLWPETTPGGDAV